MLNFMAISGTVFWVLISILVILIILLSIVSITSYIVTRVTENKEPELRNKIGSSINNTAYWLHGDDFKNIYPYILLKIVANEIKSYGKLQITVSLRDEMLKQSKKYMEGV